MRFGISTHLFHAHRLEREHLALIADAGFEAVELFATRSHFDYRDPAAVERLAGWLSHTGLTLDSVHAPITDTFGAGDTWTPAFSVAASDRSAREAAVREAQAALAIARQIPYGVLVLHLGTPADRQAPGDNHRASALRSLEDICAAAAEVNVKVAVEVIPNRLSDAASLARMLDQEIEARNAGICLDVGHAHLLDDAVEAVEIAAEHLIATHVHDNHGKADEHLVPGRGTIDWDAVVMTMQKVGYDGTWLLELADTGSPAAVLEEARRARQRFERTLADA